MSDESLREALPMGWELRHELTKTIESTEAKKCESVNFSIGWLKSFRDIVSGLLDTAEWAKEVTEGRAVVIPLGRQRFKFDHEYGTGYVTNIQKVGDNVSITAHRDYYPGPSYQKPESYTLLINSISKGGI